MRLISWGNQGTEKQGVIIDNTRFDLSHFFTDWNHDFFNK